MIGTILNVVGILIGGLLGLTTKKALSIAAESQLKVILAALTVFFGLRLTWVSLSGPVLLLMKQLAIVILSLMLGKLSGRLLRLQQFSNQLGRYAQQRIVTAQNSRSVSVADGFATCAVLFCAAPLGIVGAIEDGLSQSHLFNVLAVKAVIDGLASLGLARVLGPGVLLSTVPVLAFQGTITLISAHAIAPFLSERGLIDSTNAVAGLLVFSIALVILGLKRIELTDYLPSLFFAPFLTWLWR